MNKKIFCLDMDAFFVSVERIYQPNLIGKPVVIHGNHNFAVKLKGVVAAASYEARKHGVFSGMPLYLAYQKCPHAIFQEGHFLRYQKHSALVYTFLSKYLPVLEQASIDEFYFDLTGCEKLYSNLFSFVTKLKIFINQSLHLPCSIGMGTNKHIAKLASKFAKPNRLMFVEPGTEKDFLAPYSIKYIQGIGKKTHDLLVKYGIFTIGQLSMQSESVLVRLLGKSGYDLLAKAKGLGEINFLTQGPRKSISKEVTFLVDIEDVEYLKKQIAKLLEQICFDLRKENLKAGVLTIKIRYIDFTTKTMQQKIAVSNFENEIYLCAFKLFDKLYKRGVSLRLIGVRLSNLQEETPLQLFLDNSKQEALYQAIDKLKFRFDSKIISTMSFS